MPFVVIFSNLQYVRWNLRVVLMCISLIVSHLEHSFMWLWIFYNSFENCWFIPFDHIFIEDRLLVLNVYKSIFSICTFNFCDFKHSLILLVISFTFTPYSWGYAQSRKKRKAACAQVCGAVGILLPWCCSPYSCKELPMHLLNIFIICLKTQVLSCNYVPKSQCKFFGL